MPGKRKRLRAKRPLEQDQDSVLQDYVRGLRLSSDDERALHMFFSPHRIPVGLTDIQARIIILLFPIWEARKERAFKKMRDGTLEGEFAVLSRSMSFQLPKGFAPDKPMSKTKFRRAVIEFLEESALKWTSLT